MKFGICAGPQSGAPKDATLQQGAANLQNVLEKAGAEYFEMGVGSVMGQNFDELARALKTIPLKCEAFNSFIPAHHRITGPEVDLPKVLNYCRESLAKCAQVGGKVVVLGSAGARKVPEGFSPDEARKQFVEFAQQLGPIAQGAEMLIAIEPLNRKEDNFLIDVQSGIRLVDDIKHPNIQLLADLYHIDENNEDLKPVGDAGARLVHTHGADTGRVAPGFAKEEAPFTEFFRQCRRANYQGRFSFEGSFTDFTAQAAPLIAHLKKRWEESAV